MMWSAGRRFATARRLAAAAVVMAMKSAAAAGSRLTTDGRSVLIKRPELLTTAIASEGSRVEAIVAPASWNTGSVLDHVNSDQFVPFLRALLATAEEDIGLSNYHLRFCAHSQYDRAPARGHKLGLAKLEGECLAAAERSGCYVVLAGDRLPAREVPRAPSLEALDCPIEYTDDSGKVVSTPNSNPKPKPEPKPKPKPVPEPKPKPKPEPEQARLSSSSAGIRTRWSWSPPPQPSRPRPPTPCYLLGTLVT